MNATTEAPMTNHLRPNLSDILPNSRTVIATHVDQMIGNKLALSAGPVCNFLDFVQSHRSIYIPISAFITVNTAAAGENAQ
jgi:hypothetical protein